MKKYIIIAMMLIFSASTFAQVNKPIKVNIAEKSYVDYRNVLIYKIETGDKSKINMTKLVKDLFTTAGFKDINMPGDDCSFFTIYIDGNFPLNKSVEIINTFKQHNIEITNLKTQGGR
jgi:biopolymer transport protein ExbD